MVLAISLGFVLACAWLLTRDVTPRWTSWLGILFFGLGGVVAVLQLLPGASCLRPDANGFTYCSLWMRHSVLWSDVSEFGVAAMPGDMVGWNHVPDACPPVA